MPLAATSAYLALRPMVAARPARGLAAFAWATTGVASTAVGQGRLGALVALVLLPPVACGLWLLATRRSTATSVFATAFAIIVLGAFAPVLAALASLLVLVIALLRSRVRVHALGVAVIPVVVLGPWLVRAAEASWPVLVAGVGLAQWGGTVPAPWQLALLNPGGAGAPPWWAAVPLFAVAVLALVRGRAWGSASSSLAILAALLLGLALVAPSVRLGTVPAGVDGAGEPITLWSGTVLLPFALVLVIAVGRGVDVIRLRPPDAGRGLRAARWTTAWVAALAAGVSAGAVAWSTLGSELAPWSDPRPAVAVEEADGAFATRALFVVPGDRGAGYRFVGREAADLVRPLPWVSDADGALAVRVSALLGDGSAGPELFADTATDLLAVRSGIAPEVSRRLDATKGLQRIAPRDGWEMWRVSPTGSGQELVAPPRLRLETPDGALLVATTGQNAGTVTTVDVPEGSRLVVAEPLGWAEHAVVSVDGVTVAPEATGEAPRASAAPANGAAGAETADANEAATPSYALPPGTSSLSVTVTDPLRWWHAGQLVALVVLAFLAIPFGRRESRVGRR
jgi:hypothetical protein